ncbi:hypothetical protein O3P69_017163 [Scylla paramamosain]|uniref:Uncharacterized protein n=1 Tax=Scylla paramamosain TaxID=85552 RepID=A0AAW0TV09_SCYPA
MAWRPRASLLAFSTCWSPAHRLECLSSVRQPRRGCLPWCSKKRTVATFCFKEAHWQQGASGEYEQTAEYAVKDLAKLKRLAADLPIKVKYWTKGRPSKLFLQASLGTLLDQLEGSPASEAWLAFTATGQEQRVCWQPAEHQDGAGADPPLSDDIVGDSADKPLGYDELWDSEGEETPVEEDLAPKTPDPCVAEDGEGDDGDPFTSSSSITTTISPFPTLITSFPSFPLSLCTRGAMFHPINQHHYTLTPLYRLFAHRLTFSSVLTDAAAASHPPPPSAAAPTTLMQCRSLQTPNEEKKEEKEKEPDKEEQKEDEEQEDKEEQEEDEEEQEDKEEQKEDEEEQEDKEEQKEDEEQEEDEEKEKEEKEKEEKEKEQDEEEQKEDEEEQKEDEEEQKEDEEEQKEDEKEQEEEEEEERPEHWKTIPGRVRERRRVRGKERLWGTNE